MTGQVPLDKSNKSLPPLRNSHYLLIGSGRIARHIDFWFKSMSVPVTNWSRADSIDSLNQKLSSNPVVLLAISDKSIVSFYEQHLQLQVERVIHFSGLIEDSRLFSAHPLMSFTSDLYPIEFYSQIHWTLTGDSTLRDLFPFLKNSFSNIKSEQKALYHAACVIGGNFPVLLWSQMEQIFHELNISPIALAPYLQRVLQNYLHNPEKALTGPFVRGDRAVIEKHLAALSGHPIQNVYKSFVQIYDSSSQELKS